MDIKTLLSFDGDRFILEAYRHILGREADTNGFEYYRCRLFKGESKENIIFDIARAKNEQVFKIDGLEELINKQTSFFKRIFRKKITGCSGIYYPRMLELPEELSARLDKLTEMVEEINITTINHDKSRSSKNGDYAIVSRFFDAEYYQSMYSDVSGDPIHHYMNIGWKKGYNPSKNFNTSWYVSTNPDVTGNPFLHYCRYGINESRSPVPLISNYHSYAKDKLFNKYFGAYNDIIFGPSISILMPVYKQKVAFLVDAIESVLRQTYKNFKLYLSDDASNDDDIKNLLLSYSKKDERVHVFFQEQNLGISENTNFLLNVSAEDYIALMDADDIIEPDCLYHFAKEIKNYRNAVIFYSDEDKVIENGKEKIYSDPLFKPDFSLHYMLSHNMNTIGHMVIYEKKFMLSVGFFNPSYDGIQDFEFALRAIEKAGKDKIRHVSKVLYHWRISETSTALSCDKKDNIIDLCVKAVQEYLDRSIPSSKCEINKSAPGFRWIKYPLPNPTPLVSICIPTAGDVKTLSSCIDSIISVTDYSNYEIIIDHNGFDKETIEYLLLLNNDLVRTLRVRGKAGEAFNYSTVNNNLAIESKGQVLVFLNDDTTVINSSWLSEMVSIAMLDDVGAVGAKLYYPNNTIQHAGVGFGIGGTCDHMFVARDRSDSGYFGYLHTQREVSAVTAAAMAIDKTKFFDIGGFDESFAIAFNDIDLCLRLIRKGYVNIWTPHAELYHYESYTRGHGSDLPGEAGMINKKYSDIVHNDPYYPLYFSRRNKYVSFDLNPDL